MINNKIIIYVILFGALSGCASYYKAPTGIKTAQISFITNTRPVMVQAFANESCDILPYGVRLAYIDPALDSEGKYDGPKQIEAGKPLILTLKKTVNPFAGGSTCAMTFKFTPEARQEYIASLVIEGNTCKYNIKKKIGEKLVNIPDLKQLPKVCFTTNA